MGKGPEERKRTMNKQINHTYLKDISRVRVDSNMPKLERIIEFVRTMITPTHYMCLDWEVKEGYTADGPPIEDCFQRIVRI